jgi:hypothetical protein
MQGIHYCSSYVELDLVCLIILTALVLTALSKVQMHFSASKLSWYC